MSSTVHIVAPESSATQQSGFSDRRLPFHPKVKPSHLSRGGSVYVRQSTATQLREHQESTARQYAMKGRVVQLGWAEANVLVIDDDLGISGSGSADRQGFRRLLKLITDGEIGIVAGLEMSRLARNSKDWSDLFEVCAIFDTLIADEDGIFDPHDPNDRMVLGLKGIISEMELHTMKVRMQRGKLNKAQRGEMFLHVPIGYVFDVQRMPQLDSDDSARRVISMFFDLFEQLGSAHAVLHHLYRHDIKFPFRSRKRQLSSTIQWRFPSADALLEILKHPLYAGAYGYGRRKKYRKNVAKSNSSKMLLPEQWQVLLKDRHPAYITWEQFLRNQERLKTNRQIAGFSGPPREGLALLAGLVRCSDCGRRMSLNYPQKAHAYYECNSHIAKPGKLSCGNSIRCDILDELVATRILEVLLPAGIELSLSVVEDERQRREKLDRLYADRVEQARYAVNLAERRYQNVDPANRLVASRLEAEWEENLSQLNGATKELEKLRRRQSVVLNAAEKNQLQAVGSDISLLWNNQATIKDRKELARLMIERVEMSVRDRSQYVDVRLLWRGGFESCHALIRTVATYAQWDGIDELINRILEQTLAGKRADEIVETLKRDGIRSPRQGKPFSGNMIRVLMRGDAHCQKQLNDPSLDEHQWRLPELAAELGIRERRLKSWVVQGWIKAIQRPFGRTWVVWADESEMKRLRRLSECQRGQTNSSRRKTVTNSLQNGRKSK